MFQPLFTLKEAAELPEKWSRQVQAQGWIRHGERLLVAVSGGPDSVALLHLLARLGPGWGLQLGVAHFDHGLRGEASREDAVFVAELADRLGLPFHPGRGEVEAHSRSHRISLQMAARDLRLAFLHQVRRDYHYDLIALGHTADDQVEQFFLRLLRGTGPEGLKGMWPRTGDGLVRPLWWVGKEVILAWLHQEGLPYREDRSNLSRVYLRNRVRLELLPALVRDYNPKLREAVWRLMALLQEDETLLAEAAQGAFQNVARRPHPRLTLLEIPSFLALPPALQKRVLHLALAPLETGRELTAAHLEAVRDLARGARSGGSLRWGEALVARAGGELHCCRALPEPGDWQAVMSGPGAATAGGWRLEVRHVPAEAVPPRPWPPQEVWLKGDRLEFPLILRPWRPGDRLRPEGAPGSRKLKDLWGEAGIPRWLRGHLPVLAAGPAPVWVPGLRLAAGLAAGAGSVQVWHCTLTPHEDSAREVWEHFLALRKIRTPRL